MNRALRLSIGLTVVVLMISLNDSYTWGQAPSSGGIPTELTLPEAIRVALEHNPLVKASAYGQDIAAAKLNQAQAGLLPSLQFSENFQHGNNPVYVFGSLLEQGRFGPQNFDINALNNPGPLSNFRSSVSLRIPVFNRLQTYSHIEEARIGGKQADAQKQYAEQQTRFGVIQAYYGVLVAEARLKVADEAVKSAEAQSKRIQNLYEQGTVVASDLMSMHVQLAQFQQQQIQAQGDVTTAYAALSTALGQPVETHFTVRGQLEERTFVLPAQAQLIAAALTLRPDYLQAEMAVQVRDQEIRANKGQYLPDLNLFASVGNSTQNLSNGSSDFMAGASLTFNILDFGRSPKIREAVAAKHEAEAERDHKANQVRFEVVQAYQAYIAAKARLDVASGAVDQAQEALRITQDRYDAGLTTITEVLRGQTSLLQARLNLLGARYDYYVGYARTLLSSGQLNDVSAYTT